MEHRLFSHSIDAHRIYHPIPKIAWTTKLGLKRSEIIQCKLSLRLENLNRDYPNLKVYVWKCSVCKLVRKYWSWEWVWFDICQLFWGGVLITHILCTECEQIPGRMCFFLYNILSHTYLHTGIISCNCLGNRLFKLWLLFHQILLSHLQW